MIFSSSLIKIIIIIKKKKLLPIYPFAKSLTNMYLESWQRCKDCITILKYASSDTSHPYLHSLSLNTQKLIPKDFITGNIKRNVNRSLEMTIMSVWDYVPCVAAWKPVLLPNLLDAELLRSITPWNEHMTNVTLYQHEPGLKLISVLKYSFIENLFTVNEQDQEQRSVIYGKMSFSHRTVPRDNMNLMRFTFSVNVFHHNQASETTFFFSLLT